MTSRSICAMKNTWRPAKLQLGRSMRFFGQQCLQLHGGIGLTDEYVASHYFKRLTVMEMTSGERMPIVSDDAAALVQE